MSVYLITGAAGFIGCNYVKYILEKHSDAQIIVLDALTYAGNIASIKDEIESGKVTFIKGDIADHALVS